MTVGLGDQKSYYFVVYEFETGHVCLEVVYDGILLQDTLDINAPKG
jgi:hypothetical protein